MTNDAYDDDGLDAEQLRGFLEEYVRSLDAGDVADVLRALEQRSWRESDCRDVPESVMNDINQHLDAAAVALTGPGVDEPGARSQIRSAIAHLSER